MAVRFRPKAVIHAMLVRDRNGESSSLGYFPRLIESDEGMSKAEALRQAQLGLLEGKFAHPFFWAPFTLMGNWL